MVFTSIFSFVPFAYHLKRLQIERGKRLQPFQRTSSFYCVEASPLKLTATFINFHKSTPPWKIDGWNLQITHEKKGTWSINQTSMIMFQPLIFRGGAT